VPRVLRFLSERDLKITFFIVGQDAALEKNRDAIAQISEAGHEIGNHSFRHEPWLHLYSKDEIRDEFDMTEEALGKVTGVRPVGFRGPGFSLSPAVLEVLAERQYEYDCTTLPTYIAPLARAYYFFNSPEMSKEEREKRKRLFGKFSDGFQPLKPYEHRVGDSQLIEIPVTTFPVIKTPIHVSYLIYLSTMSRTAAKLYWQAALRACNVLDIEPSLLLHPLDFLGSDDDSDLRFFPGMNMPFEKKFDFVSEILDGFKGKFQIIGLREHAKRVAERQKTVNGVKIGIA
jgi:hypothetical protein